MTWYPPVVIVAAADEPVSLAEAKAHTRVDGNDDDTSLNNTIAAARAYVEAYCGTPLVSRTVAVKCDYFQDFAVLPLAPVSTISSITYLETAAATKTLSDDVYELRSEGLTASIVLKCGRSWPTIQPGSRITVTATVGYATLPDDIRHAMLLLIGHWHKYREAGAREVADIPHGVESLLANHRMFPC